MCTSFGGIILEVFVCCCLPNVGQLVQFLIGLVWLVIGWNGLYFCIEIFSWEMFRRTQNWPEWSWDLKVAIFILSTTRWSSWSADKQTIGGEPTTPKVAGGDNHSHIVSCRRACDDCKSLLCLLFYKQTCSRFTWLVGCSSVTMPKIPLYDVLDHTKHTFSESSMSEDI